MLTVAVCRPPASQGAAFRGGGGGVALFDAGAHRICSKLLWKSRVIRSRSEGLVLAQPYVASTRIRPTLPERNRRSFYSLTPKPETRNPKPKILSPGP